MLLAESLGIVLLFSWFFYRNLLAAIPLLPIGILFFVQKTSQKVRADRSHLEIQFKECILSVATSLRVGMSAENSFRNAAGDLSRLFGEDSFMYREIEIMGRGLKVNIPLEDLLKDLALRSKSPVIQGFSEVFSITKQNGGNQGEVIRSTAELIGRQIDEQQEIHALLSGRRMEQNIMKLMPFAILLYIGMVNKGYFDCLYGNLTGTAVMSVCLLIYLAAYYLGNLIMCRLEEVVLG